MSFLNISTALNQHKYYQCTVGKSTLARNIIYLLLFRIKEEEEEVVEWFLN